MTGPDLWSRCAGFAAAEHGSAPAALAAFAAAVAALTRHGGPACRGHSRGAAADLPHPSGWSRSTPPGTPGARPASPRATDRMDDLIEDAGPGTPRIHRLGNLGRGEAQHRERLFPCPCPRRGRPPVAPPLGPHLSRSQGRPQRSGPRSSGRASRPALTHQPEEGMEVIATGRLTTFPGQSKYQLVIEDIRPAGRRRPHGDAGENEAAPGSPPRGSSTRRASSRSPSFRR